MSGSGDDAKVPLKVAINRKNTKVLFAEVDREFVDVLLSFLALPLGRIVKLFQNHYGDAAPSIGSLNNLYKSLANLDDVHFRTKECKQTLLDPKSLCILCTSLDLKFNFNDSPTRYYYCKNYYENDTACYNKASMFLTPKCWCGNIMTGHCNFVKSSERRKNMSFSVSDELQILCDASVSLVQKVQRFCISNMDGLTTRSAQFGFDNAMEMLRSLFVSRMPLTDFALRNKGQASYPNNETKRYSVQTSKFTPSTSKKFIIKAILQKSTGTLLFVQAKEDFVDFLFSLLTVPLSAFAHLMGSDIPFLGLNNLYESVFSLDPDNHLMSSEDKSLLLKLPTIYQSTNNILPLSWGTIKIKSYGNLEVVDPKGGKGCYVQGPSMFLVSDDLTVIPSTLLSDMSRLSAMNVPIFDVEEVEIDVGVNEATRILKASVLSTTVFSDALAPALKKPKQELAG